jgi:hypothetical protein
VYTACSKKQAEEGVVMAEEGEVMAVERVEEVAEGPRLWEFRESRFLG